MTPEQQVTDFRTRIENIKTELVRKEQSQKMIKQQLEALAVELNGYGPYKFEGLPAMIQDLNNQVARETMAVNSGIIGAEKSLGIPTQN